MTDRENSNQEDIVELTKRLEEADAADAPAIAERLADRLATELDGTESNRTDEHGQPS